MANERSRASKRANGDGSIYKRGRGYEAAITVDGKRRSRRAATKPLAHKRLRELRAERDAGLLPKDRSITVGAYLNMWIADQRDQVRYSTWVRYEQYVRLHLVPVLGKIRLCDLKVSDVERLYAAKRESMSSQTVKHLHRVLHRALFCAERDEYVTRNVARFARPPKVEQFDFETYSPDECRLIIDSASEHRLGALFVLALTTGVRQGELLALRWSDIDTDDKAEVTVSASLTRVEGGYEIGKTKTGKSRSVELLSPAKEALARHRRQQLHTRLSQGGSWPDGDWVFVNQAGQRLTASAARHAWERFASSLGLTPIIRFHDLRHTYATLHVDVRSNTKEVSDALGHSRTAITRDMYQKIEPRHRRASAAKLEALLVPQERTVAGTVAGGVVSDGMSDADE
jgi:integrase